jgi:outer membrane protein assembly factor BamA
MNLVVNKRNNLIIPSKGYYFNVKLQGYAGANKYSESFGQLIPEFSVYAPLNKKHTIVLAERVGGGISVGKTTFYQSLFAGGHENLLGYRQYRFAGEHSLYNNLELRMRIANFTGYIVPGEFGFIGFYDLGRVWVKEDDSNTWHQGTGGGLYFAPAKLAVLSVVAGYSKEGWYPYVTVGFRF